MNTTFEMPEISERDETIGMYSDSYKDAHGIRPRWINFDAMTREEMEADIHRFCEIANENANQEEIWAEQQVIEFKKLIDRYINEFGAGDEKTALRWIVDGEDTEFYHYQDVEHLVYKYGILFTDYGKALVTKFAEVITLQYS